MSSRRWGLVLFGLVVGMPLSAEPISVVLSLKAKVSMEQLAHNVRDPKSSHYQRFYEPAEILKLAGPEDSAYAELIQGLKAEGMQVLAESPTHLWVSVQGKSEMFESLFATQIQKVGHRRTQLKSARVPFHLNLVQSITGLDNTRHSRPRLRRLDGHPSLGAKVNLGGGVDQETIKSAYGFDPIYASGITGQGQHIAIATYDGYRTDNVRTFYELSNLKPMPTVDTVDFNGSAKYDANSAGETELDAEFSGMIAPGSSVHVFASATNDDAGELQMFNAILDDNRAKIVNYSWGGCEDEVSQEHREAMTPVFARAVAQGVNIFVASGDSGSDSCGNGGTQADWPAANANIVAVGGTSFAQRSGKLNEEGWNGSGGGISAVWDLPDYQKNLGGIFLKRSYPDVSFNADPYTGQAIYTGDEGDEGWEVIGGTSMASPQWAGYMALVAEARMKSGRGDIGFLNPILYSMSPEDQARTLHDVTRGSNGAYRSGKGWDAVTGYGSMQADQLLDYLNSI